MSTKISLKYIEPEGDTPGAHLYGDVFDEDTVWLELRRVQATMSTYYENNSCVTIAIPKHLARQLGLLEAKP